MRMPPYMRDETATALSLTRRQYVEVMRLIDALEAVKPRLDVRSAAFAAAPSAASETGEGSALRARVRNTLARARRRVASP